MNVVSLFDGMSVGQLALREAGIVVDNYYAMTVAEKNFNNTIHLAHYEDWEFLDPIDLLIGGSPCQGFSFAGKQLNFNDPRSRLFFKYAEVLEDIQPKYFLLENVVMKQEYQDIIPNIKQPEDRGILLKDILLEDAPKGMDRVDKSGRTRWQYGQHSDARKDKSACLVASLYKGVPNNVIIDNDHIIRKFDPIEAERLQTLPDNYTAGVSNTQRYKMLGNGWTMEVLKHIFKEIK